MVHYDLKKKVNVLVPEIRECIRSISFCILYRVNRIEHCEYV